LQNLIPCKLIYNVAFKPLLKSGLWKPKLPLLVALIERFFVDPNIQPHRHHSRQGDRLGLSERIIGSVMFMAPCFLTIN
jgi:hypothetical protein